MSYDLYFYKRKTNNLSEQNIKDYLNDSGLFETDDSSNQWNYSNDETQVYFSIDFTEPNIEEEEIEIYDSFSDFENLNSYFTINFIRPSFFGYEVFPILDKIIEDLDLYILNMQDEIDPDNPLKFEKGYLEKQWINQNHRLILENYETFEVDYYPKDKSDYLWKFQNKRNEIQESLAEDIFVAGYFLIKNSDNKKLYSLCVWPSHIPVILPPVDYIIIQKEYKKLFRNIKESGLVSYQTIMSELGNYFEDFECEIKGLKKLSPQNAGKIYKIFNSLKFESSVKDFGAGISYDRFVDIKP